MVTLIDSPVANVANIARALRACGAAIEITSDPAAVAAATKLVLPGVGAFAAAMRWLTASRIDDAIRTAVANGASLLGICVGHQLLFDVSYEHGTTTGLGLLRGEVRQFAGTQIGWNQVWSAAALPPLSDEPEAREARSARPESGGRATALQVPLFEGIADGTPFYFVNSYAARNASSEIANADYDGPFTAAVRQGRVFGVQFHPEKSSTAGLRVLRNFLAWN
jgi:imidazole glycerol-phosphate synthase subunit HisH